jgi:DNA-binding CsgD family transcriptional regulator
MSVCPPDSGQTRVTGSPLVDFVMAIGEPQFAQCAMGFVNTQCAVDHISLFILDDEFVPHFLDAASRPGSATALLAGRLYERAMFYRHDTTVRHIGKASNDSDPLMFRQRAADIRDPGYRDRLYRHFGLLERISLVQAVAGRWFAFNVYRDVRSGEFGPSDTASLSNMAALLVTCAAKHTALTTALDDDAILPQCTFLETLLGSIEIRLTPRERQVCSLALMGQSVDGIAAALGIRKSTVATLRRRAYFKLGITKLNGLFALCIAKLARPAHSSGAGNDSVDNKSMSSSRIW